MNMSQAESNEVFVTEEEIIRLTDYKRAADQKRWLRDRGYRYDVGASGRPKVLRVEMERHLTGGNAPRRKPTLKVPQRIKKG